MPTKHDASLRHSQFYADILLRADRLYEEGGVGIEYGLNIFDDNWKNIEIGQKWAARHSNIDELAATLTGEYSERGAHCLYLRQKPIERIDWLESALQVVHSRGFKLVEGT